MLRTNGETRETEERGAAVYFLAVAAIWFLYILGYAAFTYSREAAALGVFSTVFETILDLFACAAAALFARRYAGWVRIAFVLISVASLGMALTDIVWGLLINVMGDMAPSGYLDLGFRIPFLVTTLSWLAFWCVLLFRKSGQAVSPQGTLVMVGVSAVIVGAFLLTYIPLLSVETPNYVHAFVLLYASVELVALVVFICCAILKTWEFPPLIGAGFILFVATDFVLNSTELTGELAPNDWTEIPWVLAETCIAVGILAFHQDIRRRALAVPGQAARREMYSHNMMSILAASGVFSGAVLAAFLFSGRVETTIFAIMVLVGFVVIAANRLSLLHGEAIRAAVGDPEHGTSEGAIVHKRVLQAFGSYQAVSAIRTTIQGLRGSAVRVGEGFTFRTSDTWQEATQRTLFFAMPYRKPWSDQVFSEVCRGASAAGWIVNRADHRFGHHDLLMNIWVEMCRSEIIVADITEETPNVLYEIGIAHAIGKPVILLLQEGGVIPFDLSVQRTIFYSMGKPRRRSELRNAVQALLVALDEGRGGEIKPTSVNQLHTVVAPPSA
jgi:hypothetical protein